MEFMREFPDDEACLQWLWQTRCAVDEDGKRAFCPKCELDRPFHRVSGRPAWDCDYCGHHLHPTAGTIFHKSSTSLQLWFYAMFLVSQTRCGISAKQLEREIGVTYKTAWRMLNKIRNQLMDEKDDEPLSGEVEVDETALRRQAAAEAHGPMTAPRGREAGRKRKKTTVCGDGRARRPCPGHRRPENREQTPGPSSTVKHVLPESTSTPTSGPPTASLGSSSYAHHRRIRHAEKIYVEGDVHTQTIEGFFGNLKRGIAGTYHAVSRKWLQGYLNEFTWRYNRRNDERAMFLSLRSRAAL